MGAKEVYPEDCNSFRWVRIPNIPKFKKVENDRFQDEALDLGFYDDCQEVLDQELEEVIAEAGTDGV